MPALSDPSYLLQRQYKDATNLNARIALHRRFSTNRYGWFRWVFDHLDLPPGARILELGCGPGYLWQENWQRVPPDWQITLSDFSSGMLAQARENLEPLLTASPDGPTVDFQLIDAQAIPYEDERFDAVIANHMLYHVRDRQQALTEIRRVLRRSNTITGQAAGRLFAATNGAGHLAELAALLARCNAGYDDLATGASEFGLENGAEQLRPWFTAIERHDYPDTLVVTEAQPLIAYILSHPRWDERGLSDAVLRCLVELVEQRLARDGVIRISKTTGMFIACRRE